MSFPPFMKAIAVTIGALAASTIASAQTIQTLGPGSAVSKIDRTATFDALAANGTPLSDYTEGGLFIATDGDSWVGGSPGTPFDPFHDANDPDRAFYFPFGGSYGWTEFRTTDGQPIYALEFMYGNGWTTGDIYGPFPWGNHDAVVTWQTWRGGVPASTGLIGNGPLLEMGTVVGFFDSAGFDQLLVKCTIANSFDPNLQALALDTLHAQLQVCTADINGDFVVDEADLGILLANWNQPVPLIRDGDLNGDGFVDESDLGILLSNWRNVCP
ncbi:MAG: hypothetical protein U1D55_14680 [Phycisphaerae bacterium]